ncbi:translation initiation factor eIF2A [Actinacidiphila yanglinensis]|uniref:non-specific serine/threonine protein kinase n=1 Tax=Actinacidiphila yanglinensis TaxID=310779 RepID=A0A1H6A2T8_9ACTN|nr:translation initiation factor eIF2A [Actinacidiphila yanglinensis]
MAGRYRLVELVGRGGMGRVWRGRDEALERDVAVKEILPPQGTSAAEQDVLVQRFRREARIAANLRHPGIVGVHDIVDHDGAPMIVMEYVAGRSLRAVLDERGPLPVPEAARIGAAVLDALVHAHAAGIVHRDVKPDNILLTAERTALTDFGVARLAEGGTTLTVSGSLIGTPLYMSPEQLEGKEVTAASDLWSLGATLYTAVEGRVPFTGETLTNLCVAILLQPPRPVERAAESAPLLEALLEKVPAERPDAEWVARFLDRLAGPAGPAGPAARTEPTLAFGDKGPGRGGPVHDGATRYGPGGEDRVTGDPRPGGEGAGPPHPADTTGRAPSRRALITAGVGAVVAAGVGIPLAVRNFGGGKGGGGSPSGGGAGTVRTKARTKATLTLRSTLDDGTAKGLFGIAFSPDGTTLAAAQGIGDVTVWDTRSGKRSGTLGTTRHSTAPGTESVNSVAFAANGKRLASGNGDGTVELWDMASRTEAGAVDAHTDDRVWTGFLNVVALSPDGKLMATSYDSAVFSLWDLTSYQRIGTFGQGDWWNQAMAFSPDGRTLVVGSGDGQSTATSDHGTVDLWDVRSRSKVRSLATTNCNLNSVAFSPDGRTLAVATGKGTVQLWDAVTHAAGEMLINKGSTASAVAFSPDGTLLATGNFDGTITLWSTATRRILATADTGAVGNSYRYGPPGASVAFSSDGRTLAGGGAHLTLWTLT